MGWKKLKFLILFFIVLTSFFVSGDSCDLDSEIINQDPYPALPGEKVEIVFQLTGIENPGCGEITFKLNLDYPFSLNKENKKTIQAGYVRNYKKAWMIPYQINVDKDAENRKYGLEAAYKEEDGKFIILETFDISVEDVRTDFEVGIEDYSEKEKEITFQILNSGENDVEALTIEIPSQENVILNKGKRKIIGPLDSNEEESFVYEGEIKEGEIKMNIIYTDEINERREIIKSVSFNPSLFVQESKKSLSLSFYLLMALIAVIVLLQIKKRLRR